MIRLGSQYFMSDIEKQLFISSKEFEYFESQAIRNIFSNLVEGLRKYIKIHKLKEKQGTKYTVDMVVFDTEYFYKFCSELIKTNNKKVKDIVDSMFLEMEENARKDKLGGRNESIL